jgi:hypothetical protein
MGEISQTFGVMPGLKLANAFRVMPGFGLGQNLHRARLMVVFG